MNDNTISLGGSIQGNIPEELSPGPGYRTSQVGVELDDPTTNSNKMRNVSITQLNSGYIVTVGCHQFALETSKSLIEKLSEYINDPSKTEKKWKDGLLFNNQ